MKNKRERTSQNPLGAGRPKQNVTSWNFRIDIEVLAAARAEAERTGPDGKKRSVAAVMNSILRDGLLK